MNGIQEFLQNKLYESESVYLDNWSIVHFISGYLLYSKFKLKPQIAIILIIGYELIEPMLPYTPETPVDTFWDIIIGIAGYYTARKYAK